MINAQDAGYLLAKNFWPGRVYSRLWKFDADRNSSGRATSGEDIGGSIDHSTSTTSSASVASENGSSTGDQLFEETTGHQLLQETEGIVDKLLQETRMETDNLSAAPPATEGASTPLHNIQKRNSSRLSPPDAGDAKRPPPMY
eukprot:scpid87257/ scgid23907/ 